VRVVLFDQFDALAIPGGGLRHLDYPTDVQSMFEELLVPASDQDTREAASIDVVPNLLPNITPRVRVYGSEQDM
jgi:hypothetical protein